MLTTASLYLFPRAAYDIAVNTVELHLHHHSDYYYDNGALQRMNVSLPQWLFLDISFGFEDSVFTVGL